MNCYKLSFCWQIGEVLRCLYAGAGCQGWGNDHDHAAAGSHVAGENGTVGIVVGAWIGKLARFAGDFLYAIWQIE